MVATTVVGVVSATADRSAGAGPGGTKRSGGRHSIARPELARLGPPPLPLAAAAPRTLTEDWDRYVSTRILPREVRLSVTCMLLFITAYLEAGEGPSVRIRRLLRICGQLVTLWQGPVILAADWQNTPDQLAQAEDWTHASALQVCAPDVLATCTVGPRGP